MESGELETVVRLWRRSREEAQPWLEERMGHTHEDDLRFFGEVLLAECEVWIALEGGETLGLLALQESQVEQLYVDPPVQGRGVGSELLAFAKASRPGGLTLYTHQRNERARAFYEGRGFEAEAFGVSPAPESEPDVRYRWPGVATPEDGTGT